MLRRIVEEVDGGKYERSCEGEVVVPDFGESPPPTRGHQNSTPHVPENLWIRGPSVFSRMISNNQRPLGGELVRLLVRLFIGS